MVKKVIGFLVILIGALLLLSNFKIIDLESIMGTVFSVGLFAIGVTGLIERKRFDFMMSAFVIVGILYFLANINIIKYNTANMIIWPLIIITIGISLIFSFTKKVADPKNKSSYSAIFSGIEQKNISQEYVSSDITTIFGGAEIDYRKINIKGDKGYINVISIFGGSTIFVPEDVKLTITGLPILGGAENKAATNEKAKKELIITYTVVFGGLEIKN